MSDKKTLVVVSGSFDPIHSGHINLLKASAKIGDIIILLRSDSHIINERGVLLLPGTQRSSILRNMKNVIDTIITDNTLVESLTHLKDKYSDNYSDNYEIICTTGGEPLPHDTVKKLKELGIQSFSGTGEIYDLNLGKNILKSFYDQSYRQNHEFSERPWGTYEVLSQGANYKIKSIIVNPGHSLSLQFHYYRAENWVVAEGVALVELNGEVSTLTRGQSITIKECARHRVSNPGGLPLVLIELQYGSYLGEDDIVRLSDNYGRVSDSPT